MVFKMTLLNYSNMSDSLILFSSDDEDSEANYETKQYNNFSAMLKGIPPPSSITISKFTVDEMLERYKNYENSSGLFFDPENFNYVPNKKKNIPLLKYSNSSHMSENIASLIQKVQERYVQLETMSSCNVWFNATLQTCGSAKKRQRMKQRIGLSPGRRLSHLARRRQFFSSANLQRLANADVRQIEIKKSDSHRCERRKIARTVEYEKLNSSKRALFLSPENGTPTKYGNNVSVGGKIFSSGSDDGQKLPLKEKSKKVEVLKWLSEQNFDVDFPRKRIRADSVDHPSDRQKKCPRRSLNFADEEVPKSSHSVATSDSSNSTKKKISTSLGKLSQNHKNKLLWAVSVVLKENNISRNDCNFKTCASTLFHKCRMNLDEILNIKSISGTSEKILHYARKEIPAIFEELGIASQISNEEKTAKKSEGSCSFENKNEIKENIIKNNSEDSDYSKSKCSSTDARSKCADLDFVFKTPNKICRKRSVKSCQKNEELVKKGTCLRKWHSLESLKDVDKRKCSYKKTDKLLEGVSVLDNSNEVRYLSKINAGIYSLKENSLGQGTVDEPSLMFSPIPSSLKDEHESPKVLFPALIISPCKSEVNSDANSCTSEANDSAEIVNQDGEIKLGIQSLLLKENLIPQASDANESSYKKNDINAVIPEVAQNKETSTLGVECDAQIARTQEESRCPESPHLSCAEDAEDPEKNHPVKSVGDHYEESDSNAEVDELRDSCKSKDTVVEKAAYKPRKLVVKKSKPNWKVVRKNSDESDNEYELRLKMRLSHEWEIVCRNSSSSEMGNASECEVGSLNCSQVSSTNDEKVVSSEVDPDESNRQSSVQSADESMDQEWEKPNTPLKRSGNSEFSSVCFNSPHVSEHKEEESTSKNPLVHENDTQTFPCPDFQRQRYYTSYQVECGSSEYEDHYYNYFRPSFYNRNFNSSVTEVHMYNPWVTPENFYDRDMTSGKFDASLQYGNIYGNVLSVSYGENHSREGDRSFTESYSYGLYNRGDSSVPFVNNYNPSERDDSGRDLAGNPNRVEAESCNGEGDWNRGLIHNFLTMDNHLMNFPNGRRDCCL